MNEEMVDEQPGRLSDEELLAATPRGHGGHEAKVGFFVLLSLVSFVVVLFWMTDPATLRGREMLVTGVNDAGGVRVGDPVQMLGVNLGRIHDVEMVRAGEVYITMEIDGRWDIPIGSRTVMGAAGLFGGRTVMIIPGTGAGSHEPWDTIPGEGASAGGLLGNVDELSAQAGSVLETISSLLNEETVGSMQGSALALEGLLVELSAVTQEQRVALQRLTETLTSAAEGLEEATSVGPDIVSAVAKADSVMTVLSETGKTLDAAMESLRSVLARMDRGEGTLGRLSTDETLYVNLNSAVVTLTALLEDLQANPKKYINLSIF